MNKIIDEIFQLVIQKGRIINGTYYPYIPIGFIEKDKILHVWSVTKEQYEEFGQLIVRDCLNEFTEQLNKLGYDYSNDATFHKALHETERKYFGV